MGAAGVLLLCLALADYFRRPDLNGIYLSLAVLIAVMAVQHYTGEGWASGKWLHVVLVLLLTLEITLNWVVKVREDIAGRWMLFSSLGFGILLISGILQLVHQRRASKGRSSDTPVER
jgi:glucan phosphoethanolaminetransferase (alkaline phosphatase superfamily)